MRDLLNQKPELEHITKRAELRSFSFTNPARQIRERIYHCQLSLEGMNGIGVTCADGYIRQGSNAMTVHVMMARDEVLFETHLELGDWCTRNNFAK